MIREGRWWQWSMRGHTGSLASGCINLWLQYIFLDETRANLNKTKEMKYRVFQLCLKEHELSLKSLPSSHLSSHFVLSAADVTLNFLPLKRGIQRTLHPFSRISARLFEAVHQFCVKKGCWPTLNTSVFGRALKGCGKCAHLLID